MRKSKSKGESKKKKDLELRVQSFIMMAAANGISRPVIEKPQK